MGEVGLYGDVGRLAARVLKPGKLLLCYGGKDSLPDVLGLLGQHLRYVTTFSIQWKGQHCNIRRHLGLKQRWTPVLVFSKGEYKPPGHAVCYDAIFDKQKEPEKRYHPWQQSLRPAHYWIEKLTLPGAVVVDFCLGGGRSLTPPSS